MSWTTPRTYNPSDVLNASQLNETRDNLNALDQHAHSGAAGDGAVLSGGIRLRAQDVVVAEVVNTTTDTPTFSATIGADWITATGMIRLTAIGDCLNNSGGDAVLRIYLSLGGSSVALWDVTIPSNANRRAVLLEAWIAAINATNAQRIMARLTVGGAASAAHPPAQAADAENSVQEDAHTDNFAAGTVTIQITAKWDTADPDISYKQYSVHVEAIA